MIIELAKNRVQQIIERKGYKFFEKGDYNLNIIGIRSEVSIANRFDDTLLCIFKKNNEWIFNEYRITTDAGKYWLKNPMNNKGTNTIDKGMFGINIHRSNPATESTIVEKWSAGCQVFKKVKEFNEFISDCKEASSIWGNKFSYTLLTYNDLRK